MSLSGNSSAKSNNYRENFFSLDDIIATHEKISCKFEVSVPHLGKSFFKLLAIIGYIYRIPHVPPYLPTEIHTELNSYGVSGCSVRFMHCF